MILSSSHMKKFKSLYNCRIQNAGGSSDATCSYKLALLAIDTEGKMETSLGALILNVDSYKSSSA
jgi:hypothetical protein